MSTIDSKRLRLLETETLSIDLEYNERFAILHIPRADKFSKGEFQSLQTYRDQWSDFFTTVGLDGLYAATSEEKAQRLLEKLEFKYLGSDSGLKVYKYASVSSSD